MSRKHWIDEFFRRRLEQGTFAVEKGELEDVHALLVKRNGTGTLIRGGRFSKWWLTALIPAAGVLWWAWADRGRSAEMPEALVSEHRANNNATVADHLAPSTTNSSEGSAVHAVDERLRAGVSETDLNTTSDRAGAAAHADVTGNVDIGGRELAPQMTDATRTSSTTAVAATDKVSLRPRAQDRSGKRGGVQSEAHPQKGELPATGVTLSENPQGVGPGWRSGQEGNSANIDDHGRSAVDPAREVRPGSTAKDARATERDGTPGADQQEQAGLKLHVDVQDGTHPDALSESRTSQDHVADQAEMPTAVISRVDPQAASEQALSPATSAQLQDPVSASEALATVRDQRETIDFMDSRWSMPAALEAPKPVQPQLPEFKLMASGELHAFGAPLAVRARSGGQRSEAQNGSLLGLEYRVRTKRFSWATGIHYGRYVLKADQGEADVSLTFVELPLLASLKFGRGRFGLLAQGGISLDLLFNSNGRYPVTGDRTSAGFPEEAFQAMNVSWSLRPQALYHVDERLSVGVGPIWKAQLGSMANDGPLEGAHITASGLSFGVTWRLDGTTY